LLATGDGALATDAASNPFDIGRISANGITWPAGTLLPLIGPVGAQEPSSIAALASSAGGVLWQGDPINAAVGTLGGPPSLTGVLQLSDPAGTGVPSGLSSALPWANPNQHQVFGAA
jgi:hypothetical protein